MAETTGIEWWDATLNLWFGCTQLSPACDNCYAMSWGPRLGVPWNGPPKRAADSTYAKIAGFQRSAARWFRLHNRPRRVFINSLSDFFDNQAEAEWRTPACLEMERAPGVIFILVTKRPQNVAKMVPAHWLKKEGWPRNVWLLVTAENQVEYDRRVAQALTIPGLPWTGISMEPMLERISIMHSISFSAYERAQWASRILKRVVPTDTVNRLGWLIVGGESGRKARPMPAVDDVRSVTRQFMAAHIPVFVKQLSAAEHPTSYKDASTFPEGLRRRAHPALEAAR